MGGKRFDLLFTEVLVYDLGVEEAEGGPYKVGGIAVYFDLVLAVDPEERMWCGGRGVRVGVFGRGEGGDGLGLGSEDAVMESGACRIKVNGKGLQCLQNINPYQSGTRQKPIVPLVIFIIMIPKSVLKATFPSNNVHN